MNKWQKRYLDMAQLVAGWSKDPSTSVGAVIVDPSNRLVSVGYNGFAQGVEDAEDRLAHRETRLRLTLHAEENAVLTAESRRVIGATCYVWPMPPCAHCAAVLVQSGIARVVSIEPSAGLVMRWGKDFDLAREQFAEAGVTLVLHCERA